MSSVVKKLLHFTPKARPRAVRGSVLTPPATQEPLQTQPQQTQLELEQTQPLEPDQTQVQPSTPSEGLLQFELHKGDLAPVPLEEHVDPIDASENAIASDDEEAANDETNNEYGDNDIFKKPSVERRRSSVAGHRRLLGISAFRRSGSMSTPAPDLDDRAAPVLIGIPVSKPVKRRASVARGSRKLARPEGLPLERHEEAPERAEKDGDASNTADNTGPTTSFVYGIHPEFGRLVKFKTLASVPSSLEVAPADMRTTVTLVAELPGKFNRDDWQLLAHVGLLEDMLMEDLCRRTLPFGSTSDNYEKSLAARDKIKTNQDNRRKARQKAREQRIPYEEALRQVVGDAPTVGPNVLDMPEQQPQESTLKVKVVNNQITLDQDSMMVRKHTADAGNRVVEEENSFENPITSSTYGRVVHTDAWLDEEVAQLYRALSAWGTDFTFIAQMFPYRTRRQVKRKFILEEKRNPQLVELALRRRLPGSFRDFERGALSKKEWEEREKKGSNSDESRFPSKARFDREIEQLKREHQRHIEEITTERERAIKEDLEASRKREIEIRTGAKPMTRSEMKAEFKKNETVVGSLD